MGSNCQPDPSEPAVDSLLNAAKSFLSHRNFEECRKYAFKALEARPNHPGPAQLIAITAVLSVCPSSLTQTEPPPDWYSILGLPRFSRDLQAVRSQFDRLYGLVDPKKNPYPFAAEAREWVLKAGEILGDPILKARFDKDLRTRRRDAGKAAGGTFWTVCPNCNFMYEYENVFRDCAIRCSNPNCGRPFAAAAVAASAAPTPDAVEKAKHACDWFTPLGTSNAENGEADFWKWWEEFVSVGSGSGSSLLNGAKQDDGLRRKTENSHMVIDLSDDDDGEKAGKEIKKSGSVNAMVRKKKKKKQAAIGKKKVMGKGIRVKWNPSLLAGEKAGCSGVQFSAGGDDIFFSLHAEDLGFGALGDPWS